LDRFHLGHAGGKDYIRRHRDKLRRILAQAGGITCKAAKIEPDISPFNPTQLPKPLSKSRKIDLHFRVIYLGIQQSGDEPQALALLRPCNQWPRHRPVP
jgi:hypothetical protein